MNAQTISTELLQGVELFAGLTLDECRELHNIAHVAEFEPGEVVLRQGKFSQNLWIVVSGQCEVLRRIEDGPDVHEIVLATLEPYHNFGEMSFFQEAPHSASVRAKTHVSLLRISREDYDALISDGCRAASKLAENTVRVLADRLRRMDRWVADLLKERPAESTREWQRFRDRLFNEWSL